MPNYLKTADATPSTIAKGGKTMIKITCAADDGGPLTLTPTIGFSVQPDEPTPWTLPPGATEATREVQVTRITATTRNCDIIIGYRGTSQTTTVTVK